jgi:hypothetical protein
MPSEIFPTSAFANMANVPLAITMVLIVTATKTPKGATIRWARRQIAAAMEFLAVANQALEKYAPNNGR